MPAGDNPMRDLIKSVLRESSKYDWTAQGFGMIRCYLDKAHDWRVNVWTEEFRVKGVSDIHNHPWHFQSWIIAGSLTNEIYYPSGDGHIRLQRVEFTPGIDSDLKIQQHETRWYKVKLATHYDGATYKQNKDEIHRTSPSDLCVTLNYRVREGEDRASSFIKPSSAWVDAKPYQIDGKTAACICDKALRLF
jgi:hypothetical protein